MSTSLGAGARTTDAEGAFEFEAVGTERMHLWLTGDAILPMRFDLDDDRVTEGLEIAAVVRCHFKVDASGDPQLADGFRVLDGDGNPLEMHVVSTDGVWRTERVPLSAGLSPTIGVAGSAATLVLERDGAEVRRVDLRVAPGELTVVRP